MHASLPKKLAWHSSVFGMKPPGWTGYFFQRCSSWIALSLDPQSVGEPSVAQPPSVRFCCCFSPSKNLGSAIQKPSFSQADLVGMNLKILSKYRYRALLFGGLNVHFRPEASVEFSSRSGICSKLRTPPFFVQFFPTTSLVLAARAGRIALFRLERGGDYGCSGDVKPHTDLAKSANPRLRMVC